MNEPDDHDSAQFELRRRRVAFQPLIVGVLLCVGLVGLVACTPPATKAPASSGPTLGWGYDAFGEVGNSAALANQMVPVAAALPAGVTANAISAGAFHSLAIGSDGNTYAWGRGDTGQLGIGAPVTAQATPTRVLAPAGVRFTAVSAGGFHSLAIGTDGKTYAWGQDSNGQLGNDQALTEEDLPVPVATPPGVHFVAISAGYAHSLAIGSDGNTYAWGYDGFYELGSGAAQADQSTPVLVDTPAGVHFTAISAGGHHSLAIGSDGNTYAWGWDAYGQIGNDAALADQPTPVRVATPAGVSFIRVAAGAHHSLAIGSDGNTYAWGQNSNGQLGNGGTPTNQPVPVQVSAPTGVHFTAVAGGGYHSLAITSTGVAYAWGYDDDGELGNDLANVDQSTPVLVQTGAGHVTAISAGYYHSLAIAG